MSEEAYSYDEAYERDRVYRPPLEATLERVAGEETALLREILRELVLIRRAVEPSAAVEPPESPVAGEERQPPRAEPRRVRKARGARRGR